VELLAQKEVQTKSTTALDKDEEQANVTIFLLEEKTYGELKGLVVWVYRSTSLAPFRRS